MTSFAYRLVEYFNPQPKSWEEYVEGIGLAFYLRNLAQNATMLAFLGWVSILHFGPNQRRCRRCSRKKNDAELLPLDQNYTLTLRLRISAIRTTTS